MANILSFLLFPFAVIYDLITASRNYFYDLGIFKSSSFRIPTICVGNLRVGGTGKSPFVEYLLKHYISHSSKVATLSRGYGRKTSGFLRANNTVGANEIGDESFQYFKRFGDFISVFVGEDRVSAMQHIMALDPQNQLVILDDAFQHRALKANLNVVLTEYKRPFYRDYLLPMGRLRESRKGVERADVVVVTKCPDGIAQAEMDSVTENIRKYSNKNLPVFFTKIVYSEPQNIFEGGMSFYADANLVLVSGIDNPIPFFDHCKKAYKVAREFRYPDHHAFSLEDITEVKAWLRSLNDQNIAILTTEKDASRLLVFKKEFESIPIFYLPIEIAFLKEEDEFKLFLQNAITTV